jgi:predicted metal-dependent hydrolase
LTRAALLADAGLHFEVHELLEPLWFRAEGAERTGLQGLIQIAVAFHHEGGGNRRGAISLLTEGLHKLDEAGETLPLELGEWRRTLGELVEALRRGGAVPPAPSWPRPESSRASSRTPR